MDSFNNKCAIFKRNSATVLLGINYFADLRMTFRQNFFLQDWFRNKFGVGLGSVRLVLR